MLIFECIVDGRAYVKKNTQRVVGRGKSKRAVYSPQFTAWNNFAIYQMKRAMGFVNHNFPFPHKVRLECHFCFKDHQSEPDLSALYEGVQDALEKAGVICNDRQVYSHDGSTKVFGVESKTIIRLYAMR